MLTVLYVTGEWGRGMGVYLLRAHTCMCWSALNQTLFKEDLSRQKIKEKTYGYMYMLCELMNLFLYLFPCTVGLLLLVFSCKYRKLFYWLNNAYNLFTNKLVMYHVYIRNKITDIVRLLIEWQFICYYEINILTLLIVIYWLKKLIPWYPWYQIYGSK